jgi:hypothetical protein
MAWFGGRSFPAPPKEEELFLSAKPKASFKRFIERSEISGKAKKSIGSAMLLLVVRRLARRCCIA